MADDRSTMWGIYYIRLIEKIQNKIYIYFFLLLNVSNDLCGGIRAPIISAYEIDFFPCQICRFTAVVWPKYFCVSSTNYGWKLGI